MPDLKISRSVAVWLIKVCTRLIRQATKSEWYPLQTMITVYNPGNFAFLYRNPDDPEYSAWLDGLVSVVKILASSLAFQIEPSELDTILAAPESITGVNELDSSYLE